MILDAKIDCYPWRCRYRPITLARLYFLEEEGFQVSMRTWENGMRAVHTGDDEAVYQDSCLECFLNFFPQSSPCYVNFEVNSNGAILCQWGSTKTDRKFLRDLNLENPRVTVNKTKKYWEITYLIPLSLIKALYGEDSFVRGQEITGNFYKCGDLTEPPHFGCWQEIVSPKPNFHLPEYFGRIVL